MTQARIISFIKSLFQGVGIAGVPGHDCEEGARGAHDQHAVHGQARDEGVGGVQGSQVEDRFYKYRHSAKQEQFNINILEEVMHMEMLMMGEMNYIMEEYTD